MKWHDVSEAVMVKTGRKVELSGSKVFIWIGNESESFLVRLRAMNDRLLDNLIKELQCAGLEVCGSEKLNWTALTSGGWSTMLFDMRSSQWLMDTPLHHFESACLIVKRAGDGLSIGHRGDTRTGSRA